MPEQINQNEQVESQKTGPQNPEDLAKKAKKQNVKAGADDFEKSLEENDKKILELANSGKKKVVDLVLSLINKGDKRVENIINTGKMDKEMTQKGELSFVENLKQNGIVAIEFDLRPIEGFPLRVKNEHGSTLIYLSAQELGVNEQELTAMNIIELQDHSKDYERLIKNIQKMPDNEFKKTNSDRSKENAIKDSQKEISDDRSKIQSLKERLQQLEK